jgi:hypothetical protein
MNLIQTNTTVVAFFLPHYLVQGPPGFEEKPVDEGRTVGVGGRSTAEERALKEALQLTAIAQASLTFCPDRTVMRSSGVVALVCVRSMRSVTHASATPRLHVIRRQQHEERRGVEALAPHALLVRSVCLYTSPHVTQRPGAGVGEEHEQRAPAHLARRDSNILNCYTGSFRSQKILDEEEYKKNVAQKTSRQQITH